MFNILDFIFLNLAFFVTVTGSLINTCEKYLPAFVIKTYRYGSFAYTGSGASYLEVLEIPKSYYRHFYVFSSIFSISALLYMYAIYFLNFNVGDNVLWSLKILLQSEESSGVYDTIFLNLKNYSNNYLWHNFIFITLVAYTRKKCHVLCDNKKMSYLFSVCVTAALIAMFLLTIQCWKRLYETYYLQIFAKSSKININHYIAGLLHYFGCVVAIIGEAPLFVGM